MSDFRPRDLPSPLDDAQTALGPFIDGYGTAGGHFDEFLDEARHLRPVWRMFAEHAGDLSPRAFAYAETRVARQIHDNGVSYNVYASGEGQRRPWALDVLPFIVAASEWEAIAWGLRQRARLMNALAADLYGAQIVLHEGLLPPAMVFDHPGFLRGCHGARPAGGVFLHLAAFDLVRGPDGGWRVGASRVQAPSGAGYALENRATISRVFPDALRALHVQTVAPFFDALQGLMLAGAPSDGEPPHVVLLTPGPYNETYFEHAFLAKHLGFQLVEGGDLTVRYDRLFVKTVSGLRRVHAVLRRVDDDYCDPLELRSDSTLGVPGLLEAWRAGQVLVSNAFGAGVLEQSSLGEVLPAVCLRLLGEPLLLPSVDAQRPASPGAPVEESLPLSLAPVWHGGRLASRAIMLRAFLVADGGGDYRVMPGGLSRIAGEDERIVSGQRGGGSKDTWVLSDAPVELPHVREAWHGGDDTTSDGRTTSSRTAEHLFWLGRYAERSENVARLVRAMLMRFSGADALSDDLRSLFLATSREQGVISPECGDVDDGKPALPFDTRTLVDGVFDRATCQGLRFNVDETVRVAGTVRDRLSSDNWRILSRLSEQFVRDDGQPADLDDTLDLIDRAILALVAVGGLEMAHMTRDDGWRFLTLGRHIERLWFVASTLESVAAHHATNDPSVLEWLLELSDSLIAYRARYKRHPEWRPVVDLLMLDARNPRSAAFQMAKIAKHVRLLPDAGLAAIQEDLDRLTHACRSLVIEQGDLFGDATRIEHLAHDCRQLAPRLGDALAQQYFNHVYQQPHATVLV